MAYRINLTEEDIDTIDFVGHRYAWSEALQGLASEPGELVLAEHEAWELAEAFESDCEGGHSMFPMLDTDSDLYRKLWAFLDRIV